MLQDRLADYEDSGVTPERVVWMKEVIEIAFDHDKSRVERARATRGGQRGTRRDPAVQTRGRYLHLQRWPRMEILGDRCEYS